MRLTVATELIRAAQAGQRDGTERLLEALWPHAYRIARSIIQNDSLAEDAAQEACAIVYRDIVHLRSADAFRVWAYRIVAREAVRVAKRHAQEAEEVETVSKPDLDTAIDVLHAVGTLPPDLRAAVVLHYYADLTSGEIGNALGIAGATVRFRLAQARRRLHTLLDDGSTNRSSIREAVL
jgi:RNA polymerase sigma factor (sigma-70 family)